VAPPEALPRWATVAVTLEFDLGVDGVPVGLRVIESAGPMLDAAFLDAVAAWRYAPALRDGAPVRVRWRARQLFGGGGASPGA